MWGWFHKYIILGFFPLLCKRWTTDSFGINIWSRTLLTFRWPHFSFLCSTYSYQKFSWFSFLSCFLKLCIFHLFLTLGLLQVPEVDHWVIPIIHGFVQVEELVVNYNDTSDEERSSPETPPQEITCVDDIHPRFTVALISRRSRHRPGKIFYEEGHTWVDFYHLLLNRLRKKT